MSNGKRITLPKETIKGLAKFAKPFESPEDCINRMIKCDCVQNEMEKQKKNPKTESVDKDEE